MEAQAMPGQGHPYFPQDAIIAGYTHNSTPIPIILVSFGAIIASFVLGCITLAKWHNSTLKRADQLTIGWFALCKYLPPPSHLIYSLTNPTRRIPPLLLRRSLPLSSSLPHRSLTPSPIRLLRPPPRDPPRLPIPLRPTLEGIRPLRLTLPNLGPLHALHRDPHNRSPAPPHSPLPPQSPFLSVSQLTIFLLVIQDNMGPPLPAHRPPHCHQQQQTR
jgi:hypothetical protein